jgi:hypothetical protein
LGGKFCPVNRLSNGKLNMSVIELSIAMETINSNTREFPNRVNGQPKPEKMEAKPLNQPMVAPLSPEEQKLLEENEAIIARAWPTFLEIGQALKQIQDAKLYRGHFSAFEVYCRQKWRYQRRYVDRLIAAAEVVSYLRPIGLILPQNESQVRPLVGLTPEQAQTVWQKVVELAQAGELTAKLVRRVVAEFKPRKKRAIRGGKLPKTSKTHRRASAINLVLAIAKDAAYFLRAKNDQEYALNRLAEIEQQLRKLALDIWSDVRSTASSR